MCTYLSQRGATYYFRRVIPTELRPAFGGRSEFMLSLRTKDRGEAKRRIPAHTMATDGQLDRARAMLAPGSGAESPETPAERVSSAAAAFMHAQQESIRGAAEQAEREADEQEARRVSRDARREAMLKRWNETHSLDLTVEEATARDLWREMREAAEAFENVNRFREATARAGLVAALPPAIGPAPTSTALDAGVMLDALITDRWAAERKVAKKGEDAHRAVGRWFYERAGRKPVDQITRKDVLAFKDALISEGQSLANVGVKLARLRTLLQWATDNEYASENVAAGVVVKDTDKARNKRLPFDLASLNRIFGSPIYTDGARPISGRGEAAYWLPLLALFTGARLEELGQLRPNDVQQIAYPDSEGETQEAWFIRIREDAEDHLKLKNAGSERDVPVHPELVRLGFIAFAEAARRAGQERLFPALKPNTYGRLTAKWGEWFGPLIRRLGVTDKRMVFHSFRHTFKDYARHAQIAEGIQRQIMGHSSGDVADQYGSGYSLHQVVEGMRRYRVPGVIIGSR